MALGPHVDGVGDVPDVVVILKELLGGRLLLLEDGVLQGGESLLLEVFGGGAASRAHVGVVIVLCLDFLVGPPYDGS